MATTSDIRNGLCIDHNGEPFQIIEFLHVKPGKGNAFVRTKMRNLNNGRVLEHTFPAGSKLNEIRIENRSYQYLYNDAEGFHFMNTQTFEQITLQKDLINSPEFLIDGMEVNILFHADEERPLSCELPSTVVLEVTYTEPGIKGNTATNTLKPATMETGAEVRVPLFIEQGEKIVIDTTTGSYKERAKE
ncbi:MAG: elongation factor P [Bacteroidota bacterium]|nr:elongation factor P [Bacteroidota bacterium]MDX5447986.1 elongation factor P [Bacteroidota bacterium]MDX5504853.1 elongation factor P [Bacteroidota bacterium]